MVITVELIKKAGFKDMGTYLKKVEMFQQEQNFPELTDELKLWLLENWKITDRKTILIGKRIISMNNNFAKWNGAVIEAATLMLDKNKFTVYSLDKNILPVDINTISDVLNLETSEKNKNALIRALELF